MTSRTITKLEIELKISGKLRDFNFIVKQYEKKRLYLNGTRISTKKKFEQYRLFIRLVNEIYEGHWDVDFALRLGNDRKLSLDIRGVVLHFPEITISNTRRRSHVIKDMFVRLCVGSDRNDLYLYSLEGGRSTFTYAEVSSDYSHSHLSGHGIHSGQPVPFYRNFCTGSGHINDFLAHLNSGEFTETNLTRFLVQIMGLISHESLDGGPYRLMENIMVRTRSGRRYSPDNRRAETLYNQIIHLHKVSNTTPDIEFVLENNKYRLVDNEKFDRFLQFYEFSEQERLQYLCMIDETGAAYAYGQSPQQENIALPTTSFIFRGETIPLVVTQRPSEQTSSAVEYKIHPQLKQYIKQLIEYDINKKSIRKSTIDRYSN